MGRLKQISVVQDDLLLDLFRVAARDAIYALLDTEFAKLAAARDAATVTWLTRAMQQRRWADLGTALMDYAICRDATLLTVAPPRFEAEQQALEDRVEALVAAHLPKFVALDL